MGKIVKVTIGKHDDGYVAFTTSEPWFCFIHSDLKALSQHVDNSLRFFEEFHDNDGMHFTPDYVFSEKIYCDWVAPDVGSKN